LDHHHKDNDILEDCIKYPPLPGREHDPGHDDAPGGGGGGSQLWEIVNYPVDEFKPLRCCHYICIKSKLFYSPNNNNFPKVEGVLISLICEQPTSCVLQLRFRFIWVLLKSILLSHKSKNCLLAGFLQFASD